MGWNTTGVAYAKLKVLMISLNNSKDERFYVQTAGSSAEYRGITKKDRKKKETNPLFPNAETKSSTKEEKKKKKGKY